MTKYAFLDWETLAGCSATSAIEEQYRTFSEIENASERCRYIYSERGLREFDPDVLIVARPPKGVKYPAFVNKFEGQVDWI